MWTLPVCSASHILKQQSVTPRLLLLRGICGSWERNDLTSWFLSCWPSKLICLPVEPDNFPSWVTKSGSVSRPLASFCLSVYEAGFKLSSYSVACALDLVLLKNLIFLWKQKSFCCLSHVCGQHIKQLFVRCYCFSDILNQTKTKIFSVPSGNVYFEVPTHKLIFLLPHLPFCGKHSWAYFWGGHLNCM